MSKTEDFLTSKQEAKIVEAIRIAEENTSGEIRVHIEEKSEKPPIERATEVFNTLKMYETEARNGVLFYINVSGNQFAIIGDEGINKVVPSDFWECTKDIVLKNFVEKKNKKGLVKGIKNAGKQLKKYFPYQADDTNELSNEISKG
ncbi:TPM domain-containing protein [uncultured Flavobacterium sp.]|uniref:TPM domain-containing protein n=1 Tax=uncultured Flavobacterium sp. TaxID=165435 RepID=UPI0030EF8187|tara:strand:+ start:31022 stop:31459 length:438 start_codon:yes stop_codon:yes gene_type:complete